MTHLTDPEDRAKWLAIPEDQRRQWFAWMWPIEPIHYVGCASPATLLFHNGTLDIYILVVGVSKTPPEVEKVP